MVYLTEVARVPDGRAHCFGGGLYVGLLGQHVPTRALIGRTLPERRFEVDRVPATAIDYHAMLPLGPRADVAGGDTVLMAFRFQVFVTRARVAALIGLRRSTPTLVSIWDAHGGTR